MLIETARSPARLCILLALYDGEAYLEEQLDSYLNQGFSDWSLLVSDDGSTDSSLAILHRFAERTPDHDVRVLRGPGTSFSGNFLHLLRQVSSEHEFVALSDQDDVWYPDKLQRAVTRLADVPADVPCLYAARTRVCDVALRPLGLSREFSRAPSFRNALVQSIGGGNTMLLNRAAVMLAKRALVATERVVAHDWWLYQLVSGAGGTVLYDPAPALDYRQHGGNLIGENRSLSAAWLRLAGILGGRFRSWNEINAEALAVARPLLTSEARKVIEHYAAARQAPTPFARLRGLRASGVWRQGRLGTAALHVACLLRLL
ncbi:glycosyltransferase family 2 protein [Rhodosalinus sp. FB01]|uniref:glycosyltransferase family 2 protein n=1 Tax=Rhodosalinus sp. FB01 TaxID=3239194 RepID=UPI003526A23C